MPVHFPLSFIKRRKAFREMEKILNDVKITVAFLDIFLYDWH
ncbi:hypothetical protein B4168_0978 [Anoxybacillus flavithermus]|nr:hypothetical protein B4168_0978 [Anoxybacillus flavithermus]OAO86985.1 hypothetical protein GT23_2003 [Parageobacillus thermoglucosidasius]